MANTLDPLLLSVEEACSVLGIRRTLLLNLAYSGDIESLKLGRRRLFPREALSQFIARERERQASAPGLF